MNNRQCNLKEISEIIGIDFIGQNVDINALNLCSRDFLHNKVLSYVANEKFIKYLSKEEIRAVFISKNHYDELEQGIKDKKSFFLVDNPEKVFYDLHNYLYKNTDFYKVELSSKVGENVVIHPTAYVENGVTIGNNVTIGPKAIIHSNTVIGDNVEINSGAIIGSQGFQLLYDEKVPYMAKHVGGVKIGNNVLIGANTTIANSLFEGYTEIGNNTKIDDLVFIAHNCKIGENCVLIAGAIMTGSSSLDDNVWLAPNSVILNQINVSKNSFVGASSLVTKNVDENTKVFGLPAKKIGRMS